jgi:cell division protein FtsB
VYYLQEENTKLEKQIAVNLKAEVARQLRDNEKLTERNRVLGEDTRRLEQQIQRLLSQHGADPIEKREEGELWRQRRI